MGNEGNQDTPPPPVDRPTLYIPGEGALFDLFRNASGQRNSTLIRLGLLTGGLVTALLIKKGVTMAADTIMELDAFRLSLQEKAGDAALRGKLQDFQYPILLSHPALEMAIAAWLRNSSKKGRLNLEDISAPYKGGLSGSARPTRHLREELYIRRIDLNRQKGERPDRFYFFDIVGSVAVLKPPIFPEGIVPKIIQHYDQI